MKKSGVKTDRVPSESFTRRLNNLMAKFREQLIESHFAGMTGPVTLRVNMTQGMINTPYVQIREKFEIE